jgi:hypothetical protein
MDYVNKKILAYSYYLDPSSPTFFNALRSLTRAGYSYSYARSYGRQVFLMDRFIDVLFGKTRGRGKEDK